MSKTTFVDSFFAWLSHFNIDFKAHVDPWCKDEPQHLACDGTHVGIALSRVHMKPIEENETQENVVTLHIRYDRVFLPYRSDTPDETVRAARIFLRSICDHLIDDAGMPPDAEFDKCLPS